MQVMPRILSVAGSDSGGGAGIQADIKTIFALGGYPLTAVAALTAQNTLGITRVEAVAPEMLAAQLDAVLSDIGADAVKLGMLYSVENIRVTGERLAHYAIKKVVTDPMLEAGQGGGLLAADGLDALKKYILPRSLVVTPNLPEAEALSGIKIDSAAAMERAARVMIDYGPAFVMIKGGHAEGTVAEDILFSRGDIWRFAAPRQPHRHTHGTGCTFSAALAVYLGYGREVPEAFRETKNFMAAALSAPLNLGKGTGPVNQYAAWEKISARRS